jgi:hypothetical protein
MRYLALFMLLSVSGAGLVASPVAGAGANDDKLTAEGAKEALLKMLRSDAGKKLGWFNDDDVDEIAKFKVEEARDGWYSWTGEFRFHPAKGVYTLEIRPRPGARACAFSFEGTFAKKERAWVANPPRLVSTALQSGE